MTLRRLWVLVSRLPQESATSRAIHGELADWSQDTYLLARIANTLQYANGQRAGKRVPESALIHPPTSTAPRTAKTNGGKRLTQAEFDALF
ncbi:hypothetical protein [Actinomadura sp. 9N215]|uniref:hypothetical protein n=1 Tax=Actinomadura sp. 9N215 TaxID=3375150 RepID=UPI0037B8CFAA